MKHFVYSFALSLMLVSCGSDTKSAKKQPDPENDSLSENKETPSVPNDILVSFREIAGYIQKDDAQSLAKLVAYPLNRPNPLPDIKDEKEFIQQFPVLFDAGFKQRLKGYNDSIVFEHNGEFGLAGGEFTGDLWINDNGQIIALNYSSEAEKSLQAKLLAEIKKSLHLDLREFEENLLVAKAEGVIVRLDQTESVVRFALWQKGKQMSDEPDVIIFDGSQEMYGSQGGWGWTFSEGNISYLVDNVEMCEEPYDGCGLFLRTIENEEVKSSLRLTKIK